MSDDLITSLRALAAARHDDLSIAVDAVIEIERLREENERLRNEDTKTRHALKGWVFVCPDGGDEPTHERVAAVVAEVERLRAQLNAAVTLLAAWSHAVDDGGASWDCWDTHYKEARWGKGSLRSLIDEEIAKLEGKP